VTASRYGGGAAEIPRRLVPILSDLGIDATWEVIGGDAEFLAAGKALHFRVIYRDHLLRSLVPLYLGRTAAFVLETQALSGRDAEAWVEDGALAFERQKPYPVDRWR
jgi:hypothetical protein